MSVDGLPFVPFSREEVEGHILFPSRRQGLGATMTRKYQLWDACSRRSAAHKHEATELREVDGELPLLPAFDPHEALEILGARHMCGRSWPTGML